MITTPLNYTCDSFNLIYVVICDKCKVEYIGETGVGKTKLRNRVQPQYQHSKVEGITVTVNYSNFLSSKCVHKKQI